MPSSLSQHRHPGATLLITVLVVGAAALVIGMSTVLRGIGDLEVAARSTMILRSLAVADACLEETLTRRWGDASFGTTPVDLSLEGGTCTTTVEDAPEDQKLLVRLRAEAGRSIRHVRAVIDTSGHRLRIASWDLE